MPAREHAPWLSALRTISTIVTCAWRCVQCSSTPRRIHAQHNTQTQAAEILGVSTRTVRNYIRSGRLKLNGCGLLPIEAIDVIRSSQ